MELPIDAMGKLSIENLIAMLAMFWIFYSLLTKKFEKIDNRFEKIESDIKELRNDMKEMRTSLNRLEGALMSKECCMLKPDNQMKKAE